MALRSSGIGAETTGELISFIHYLLLGIKMDAVPRATIQRWDKIAGTVMVNMILDAVVEHCPQALSWMQDSSSGARYSSGWHATVVGLSLKHPAIENRVISFILDTKIGYRNLSEVKCDQLKSCDTKYLKPRNLPTCWRPCK